MAIKLDAQKAAEIRRLNEQGLPMSKIARLFGITISCVKNVIYNVSWREENKVVNGVSKTVDYDQFKRLDFNREVDKTHVNNIARSFQQHPELLSANPILVDKHMNIYDGQHRFEAAKKIGAPVYFTQMNHTLKPDVLITLNANQRSWTLNDYLNYYASQGNDHYIRLKDSCEKHGFNPRSILYIAKNGQPNGSYYEKLKNGKAEFNRADAQRVDSFFYTFKRVLGSHKHVLNYRNVKAFLYLKGIEGFDIAHLEKVKSRLGTDLHNSKSARFAFDILVSAYNYRLSDKNKLVVTNKDYTNLERI